MRIAFITNSLSSNSLGRTYCLWRLSVLAGWNSEIISTQGDQIWEPLRGTEFAAACRRSSTEEVVGHVAHFGADLVCAVKPLLGSFGAALKVRKATSVPVLLDIDDPDIEHATNLNPLQRVRRMVQQPESARFVRKLDQNVQSVERTVSNPWLQERHGGTLIPHTRPDFGVGPFASGSTGPLTIAFVGTDRPHKGLSVLRAALRRPSIASQFRLIVTDYPPRDAEPWESWVGPTSLSRGIEIVKSADLVVLPSLRTTFAVGQLPAKLIDAMIAGRGIIVSDVPPLPWAVGNGGLVVPAGSESDLASAMLKLSQDEVRQRLGEEARLRALSLFSEDQVVPSFVHACESAMRN